MPAEGSSAATVLLAKDFLTLQEERVRQYAALNEAHKTYLSTGPDYDLEPYKSVVDTVTAAFKELSERISEMRVKFDTDHRSKDLANLLGKVQLGEKKKLQFTVDLQLALQQARDNPDDELMERNVKGLKGQLNVIVEEINETLAELRHHVHDLEGNPSSA